MTEPAPPAPRSVHPLLFLATTAAIWLARLRLPLPPAGPEVDASWQQALGRALALKLRFGRDIWFTHGPLGYFPYGRYEPELFEAKLFAWELAFKGVLAGFFAAAVLRIPGRIERVLALLVVLLFAGGEDAYAAAATLAIAVVCLDARGRSGALVVALGMTCLAALSLAKFTWFVFAAGAAPAVALALAAGSVRSERSLRSVQSGGLAASAYAAALALLWLACGQSLGDAWSFLVSSVHLAAGYASAMSLVGPRAELELAFVAGALTVAAASLRLYRTRSARDACLAAAVTLGLFVAWKSGFTRHLHEANRFFAFAALAPLLLASRSPNPSIERPSAGPERTSERLERTSAQPERPRGRIELAAVALAFVAGASGFFLALGIDPRSGRVTRPTECLSALRALCDPRELETELIVERDRLRDRYVLERVQAEVGSAPIDLIGSSQGRLFLNQLVWRPRPVFQSYAAYSPFLMEANAAFLAGPRAPRFALLAPGRIDRRYPVSADAAAVVELLRRYEPVFWEKGHLLLRRRDKVNEPLAEELVQRSKLRFGEEVQLVAAADTSELLLLRLRFERTTYGRAAGAWLREPELVLHALLADGGTQRLRLIRGPFEHGVPAAPLFLTASVWNEWYLGEPPSAVRALKIEAEPGARRAFADEIELELSRVRLGDTTHEGVPQIMTLPSFFPQPTRIVSRRPATRRTVGGRPALVVNAPSKVTYALAPGTYRLRGSYGFAERDDGNLLGNATRFAAALRRKAGQGGNEVVLEDTLLHDPGDPSSPVVAFDVTLALAQADGPAELVLLTAPAAGREGDGAFWRDVTIERVTRIGPGKDR